MALSDDLERISELHQRGVLDDDEFAAAKAKLLAGGDSPADAPTSRPPVASPVLTASPKMNTNAIVSLITGIGSMVMCPLLGIVGLITGSSARRQIRESNGAEQGEGLATAGIVTSIIGLVVVGLVLLAILSVTLLGQKASSKFSAVGSAVSDVRVATDQAAPSR